MDYASVQGAARNASSGGSKDAPSNFIHTTRDLLVAAHFAMSRRGGVRTTSGYRSARTIVAIDMRRLQACRILDISTEANRIAHGIDRKSKAWQLTSDCAEVAIQGQVPAEAIIGTLDALQVGIQHRQTEKQTVAEFKATTSHAARWRLRDWATTVCTRRHAA